jgi:cation diffusion facilitator CzcD-associated flavoprotein CzcO
MQPEIQAYFRGVAEQYRIVENIRFHTMVEKAAWDDNSKIWTVTLKDLNTKTSTVRRCKILVSAVGALSVPKKCTIPGAESFKGPMFHSAQWDHDFNWEDKEVVVLGNGCSATQFLPIMASGPNSVKKITQFSRQAQYLSERENPYYSGTFKAVMKYAPLAMRIYRAHLYWQMERDYTGFDIKGGAAIRQELAKENEAYVKRAAPERYWDALIPKTEIGCKRKVLDTEYLASLHKSNVELVSDDPVEEIVENGVRTRSGREVQADALVLAIGFATQQMLFPMEIVGRRGLSLNKYVSLLLVYLRLISSLNLNR